MNKKTDNLVIVIAGAAIVGVLLVMSACTSMTTVTTLPNGTLQTNVVKTLDLNRVTNAINAAVPGAVRLAVKNYPQSRQWVQDASTTINTLLNNGTYDPAMVNLALHSSGSAITEQQDVLAAIDLIVGLYRSYYGDVITQKLDQKLYLGTILRCLGTAIDQGLETAPL